MHWSKGKIKIITNIGYIPYSIVIQVILNFISKPLEQGQNIRLHIPPQYYKRQTLIQKVLYVTDIEKIPEWGHSEGYHMGSNRVSLYTSEVNIARYSALDVSANQYNRIYTILSLLQVQQIWNINKN